jgi:hypothetical protein
MEFLRADDEVNVGQPVDEFLSPALRHAPHESKNLARALLFRHADDGGHFSNGLLLGEIAHAASIEQHDVGDGFGLDEGVAFGDELGGDGFAIALVHLASVSFDKNTRHILLRITGKVRE